MPATVWKGYLSFGLVTFPVRLHSAARPGGVHFHMLHSKDQSRVKEVWYCVEEDKPIARDEIVKGYEAGKDQYVVIEDKEIEAIAPPTAATMEIQQFVAAGEVDPIYFEKSYYVAPEEKVNKAYALFYAALAESKRSAIAKVAMHNREHVVLIRPTEDGLLLHTLYYTEELNAAHRGEPAKAKYTAKELELAKTLVNQMTTAFRPNQYHDEYKENVEKLVEQKKKGQKITMPSRPRKAPVINLMDALKRSLKSGAADEATQQKTSAQHKNAKASKRRRAA